MAIRDVTCLRKEGKLEEALALARQELAEDPNEWTRMSLFWVLRGFAKNIFIPNGEMEKAKDCLKEMGVLLPNMMDGSGAGEQAYNYLRRQILPNADKIKEAAQLSRTDPNKAYESIITQFGKIGEGIDESLHEDFGWIVYRYMKANSDQLTSVQTRCLLRDYMLLKNERPSMLHSTVLNYALNFSKGHKDFSFYRFFIMWGTENLRYEDFVNGHIDGCDIPSLISRICRAIIDYGEPFPITDFVDKFQGHRDEVIEHLRQAYFWKLMGLHKDAHYDELWKAFDYYADSFSSLGSSHWHSEILKIACRFMADENTRRFFSFMKRWAGPEMENIRKEDWAKEKGEDGREYPSLAVKSAKKCFECFKQNHGTENTQESLYWLKQLYAQVIKNNAEDDWSTRNYATVCIWSGDIDEAIAKYKSLLVSMGDKFYLWSELSECIRDNNDLRIGLLLKAKEIEKNEDFLGDIHLSLAKLWIEEGVFDRASTELDAYAKHRKEKGWVISNSYIELSAKLNSPSADKKNIDLAEYIRAAENFVYADLPVKYGVVDYINKKKNVLHILTQESKLVFFSYKKRDIQIGSFVRFRGYEEKRKDDVVTRIVNVSLCPKEEALPKMKSRVVVVDDVNEQKQLFHVVLGGNLISDIVRFDQTDVRPEIGDFLRITYCVRENREGKKRIKFLDITTTDERLEGVTKTVSGRLSVKHKDCSWNDDDDGNYREPDFAFVEDFYVHLNILRKYGITDDCDVIAKVMLGGENRMKVYAIDVQ